MLLNRRHLMAAAALAPWTDWAAAARNTPSQTVLELARNAPEDLDPAGFLVSEKLDGVRAHWDGQRLRFRSGLDLLAPAWFLAQLPAQALDGELWIGRGRFDEVSGAVRQGHALDAAWRPVRYEVFDLPGAPGTFAERAQRLQALAARQRSPQWGAIAQSTVADRGALAARLDAVVKAGGEGLVLHRADAPWRAGRSDAVFKLKPVHDAEAVVVAHVPGRGRHQGRLGALQVRTTEGVEFLIGTGLSDAQRNQPPALGSVVSFTHRGLTPSGVQRFASFLRERDPLRS